MAHGMSALKPPLPLFDHLSGVPQVLSSPYSRVQAPHRSEKCVALAVSLTNHPKHPRLWVDGCFGVRVFFRGHVDGVLCETWFFHVRQQPCV